MRTFDVNPLALALGTATIPIAANALGRAFIAPKAGPLSQVEANAEFRRIARNFAVFNALAAAGLGYAASRVKDTGGWQTGALLGGAVGTGLVAVVLGGALLTGPSAAAADPAQLPAGGGAGAPRPAVFGAADLIGYPR